MSKAIIVTHHGESATIFNVMEEETEECLASFSTQGDLFAKERAERYAARINHKHEGNKP